MNHTQSPSIIAYNKLISVPATGSVFWAAFNAILADRSDLAEDIFFAHTTSYKLAIEYRYLVARFTGPWWAPFNCPLRHGKLGTLACKSNVKAIKCLHKKGEASGIQIAHAMIECSLDLAPNVTFTFSADEKISLLKAYAMEAAIFGQSVHAFHPSLAWLSNRTKRAVQFFNAHASAYWGSHSPVRATMTTTDSKAVTPVKWPDRLYDLEGVSTSLAYSGN